MKNADPSIADPMEEICEVQGHVVTIAQTSGGRDGYYILCDTERWTVTLCDFQVGPGMGTKLSRVRCSICSYFWFLATKIYVA